MNRKYGNYNKQTIITLSRAEIDNCKKRMSFEENEIEVGKIMIKIVETLRYKGGDISNIDYGDLTNEEDEIRFGSGVKMIIGDIEL